MLFNELTIHGKPRSSWPGLLELANASDSHLQDGAGHPGVQVLRPGTAVARKDSRTHPEQKGFLRAQPVVGAFRPGVRLQLPLPTSCSLTVRVAAPQWVKKAQHLLRQTPLGICDHTGCSGIDRAGGAPSSPYLRGLSLNRVLWLPATELPPLLLLPPSSSTWE